MEREIEQDTLETAKKIREHQGYHEAEVTCGGEADLHRHLRGCKKNPSHCHFIPVHEFKMEHLPSGYQDKDLLDWIGAEADLTCRLSVRYTSELRPQVFPGRRDPYPFFQDRGKSWMRVGTGWVFGVNKYTYKDKKHCECNECCSCKPSTNMPKKFWGEVVIGTACHVVFNSEEARRTTCHFSYNSNTIDVSQCPALTGLKVVFRDIEGDVCRMTCVTHDMNLLEKLVKMCDQRFRLFEEVRSKYWSDPTKIQVVPDVSFVRDPTPGPVVIISHPHGCSKHITVGEWTHRQLFGETKKHIKINGSKAEYVDSLYRYTAATCRGSSGAPVFRLMEKGRVGWWWLLYAHPHSGGDAMNNNFSGMMEEFVSFPRTSIHKLSKLAVFLAASSTILVLTLPLRTLVVSWADWWESIHWIVCLFALIFFFSKWFIQCYRDHSPLPGFMATILLVASSTLVATVVRLVFAPLVSLGVREGVSWVIFRMFMLGTVVKVISGLIVNVFWGWGIGDVILGPMITDVIGWEKEDQVWGGMFGVIWEYIAGFTFMPIANINWAATVWPFLRAILDAISMTIYFTGNFIIFAGIVSNPVLSFRVQHKLRQWKVKTTTTTGIN